MLCLTLLALLCYQAWAMCPSGFELVRNGECHRELYGAQNTYAPTGAAQAISFCADYGAIPVNIKNQEDHDYWVSVAKAEKTTIGSDYGNIILGIYCDNTNHWMWADGREVYYEWKPEDYDEDLHERCGEQGAYCMWTINPVTNNWQKWCNTYQWTANYCIIEPTEKPAEPDRDCTNFDHEDDDDLCYQVGKYPANYTEANTICHSFGANVASIHNERENTFVRRLAASHGLINGMMLGAAYNSKKNSFKWADGTTWDYDNFAPGFPLVGFGECVAMETNNIGGQWINIDCSTELPFACIRQPDDEDPVCDGALRKENDIIYNPGFPSDASIPCDFILKVDPGKLVEVEILMLEANSCCDRLVLTEGTLGGAEIATLTGEMYNGWTFRTTSQNVMRVSWQPHGGVNVKGMMITFRGV